MTQITKEAIDAACEAAKLYLPEAMRAALEAALPLLPIAVEGKVGLAPAKAAEFSRMVREYRANSDNDHGARMQEDLEMFLMENLCEIDAVLSSPGKDGGQEVGSTHEERIALAAALTWDVNNITPDEVREIIERLAAEGFRLQRVGGQEVDVRTLAVEIVDGLRGYTFEFSSHPTAHAADYDLVEECIRSALSSSTSREKSE